MEPANPGLGMNQRIVKEQSNEIFNVVFMNRLYVTPLLGMRVLFELCFDFERRYSQFSVDSSLSFIAESRYSPYL
jgi:hypothetical protein